jgi:hypothetical protein
MNNLRGSIMKYIRTEDGIYEYVDYDNECIIPSPIIKYKNKLTHCSECDIIKQADTIEELCDVIVCNEKLFYPLTSNREGNKFNWEEIISCSHNVSCNADYKGKAEDLYFNIYGAIWTKKGLIYVAKMNDKGELELND